MAAVVLLDALGQSMAAALQSSCCLCFFLYRVLPSAQQLTLPGFAYKQTRQGNNFTTHSASMTPGLGTYGTFTCAKFPVVTLLSCVNLFV